MDLRVLTLDEFSGLSERLGKDLAHSLLQLNTESLGTMGDDAAALATEGKALSKSRMESVCTELLVGYLLSNHVLTRPVTLTDA